jgi:hypothetical protein
LKIEIFNNVNEPTGNTRKKLLSITKNPCPKLRDHVLNETMASAA